MHSFVQRPGEARRNHINQENGFLTPQSPLMPPSRNDFQSWLDRVSSPMASAEIKRKFAQQNEKYRNYAAHIEKRALGDVTERVLRKQAIRNNARGGLY